MSESESGEWRRLNHAWWDERALLHADTRLYRDGAGGLEDFEWRELPPVDGLEIVHPQCHIGTDTSDLASAGARTVGIDFSANAIAEAGRIADTMGLADRTEWLVSDVYDASEVVDGRTFDAVYTGKGALCWLPDLNRWAETMWSLLRPGGFVYLSEMHPLQDIMSEDDTDIERSYFPSGGDVFEGSGSYAAPDAVTTHNVTVDFVHPLSGVLNALLGCGFALSFFNEHSTTVFPRWPWLETDGDGVWRMPSDRPSLPLMYSLRVDRPRIYS